MEPLHHFEDKPEIVCWPIRSRFRFNMPVSNTMEQPPKPHWFRVIIIGRRPRLTLVRIVVLVAVCILLRQFVLLPIRVQGISMQPTYHTGQINCVNRLAYLRHEPQRGDVVSVRLAGDSIMLMKRIIGLPGESVAFHEGKTYINGKPLDEPYLKKPCDWEEGPFECATNEYYVVGDNRSMPFGLHTQGRAVRDRIVGKVLL
jgi:signal peptidase I